MPTSYLAVIHDPSKERPSTNLLMGHMSALEKSAYSYARSIQLPPVEDPNAVPTDSRFTANAVLKPVIFRTLRFLPQTNLDIDKDLWQIAVTLPITQDLVSKGALTVIQPDEKLLKNYPEGTIGYKCYSPKDAIKLVEHTYSLDSLELWSEGEERAEVLAAIAKQKQSIEKHLRMLAEGSYDR